MRANTAVAAIAARSKFGGGCFASMALQARFGKRWIGDTLVPVAAGFIIGEALTNLSVVLIKLAVG